MPACERAEADVLLIIAERTGKEPRGQYIKRAHDGELPVWGMRWNNHAGYVISKSPELLPRHAFDLPVLKDDGTLDLMQQWPDKLRLGPWRDRMSWDSDIDRVWPRRSRKAKTGPRQEREAAARALLAEGVNPPRTVPWLVFSKMVAERCGHNGRDRGYSVDQMTRLVRKITTGE